MVIDGRVPTRKITFPKTMTALLLRCILAVATVFGVPYAASAAPTEAWTGLGDTVFQHIAQDGELPNGATPTALAEDGDGFLWVGTQNGLARWDGYHFHLYLPDPERKNALPDRDITALYTDSRDRLWIATAAGGLARYDRDNDRFISYPAGPHGLSSLNVLAIADDVRGRIWVGTAGGLDELDPDSGAYRHVKPNAIPGGAVSSEGIHALLRDRRGTLWLGSEGGLARRRSGETNFRAIPLATHDGKIPAVWSLAEDGRGRIWIGTGRHGAFVVERMASRGKPVVETGAASALPTQWVHTIAEVRTGEVWLGTYSDGIVAIDTTTMRTRRIRHDPALPSSLPDDTPWVLHRDRSGLVWVSTNRSLSRYDPRQSAVTTLFGATSRKNGVRDSMVASILALPDGRVWVGLGSKGVDVLDPAAGRIASLRTDPTRPDTALSQVSVNAVAFSATQHIYLATDNGLYRADRNGDHVARLSIPQRAPTDAIWSLLIDRDILWFGGSDGLWGIDLRRGAAKKVIRPRPDDRLTDQRVSAIKPGPGRSLWIGTESGLNRFDIASRRIERIAPDAQDPAALAPGFIGSLLTDRRGRLWVGTDGGGINVFERRDARGRPRFHRIGLAQGLPNDDVNMLLADRHGDIWVSTDDGLAVIDPVTFAVRTLGRADGVAISRYNSNAGAVTSAGDLLFGGLGGLSIVRPDRLRTWNYHPPIVVTELRIGGKAVPAGRLGSASPTEPATIAADANSIAVEFSALDYSAPEHNRYAYRLDGFDKDWAASDAARRLAAYTNIPPGDYALQIRGSNRNGVWSTQVSLPIRVLPAWYQTIWVRVIEVLAVVAVLAALIGARTAYFQRREHELEQQVADRTAELEDSRRHLEQIAYSDLLTALPNRRMFTENFRKLLALTRQQGGRFALLLIDLDQFKQINDTLGHDAGDALLVEAAARLRDMIRESDSVSRLGGDEFAILLAETLDVADIELVCRRIVESFVPEVPFNGKTMRISPSIGVAMFPADGETQELLYKRADLALYEAKRTGRNTWRWYHSELGV